METWLCISASRWNKTRIFDLLTTYILNTENWYASAVGAAWRVSKSPEATKADVSLSQAHTPLRRISWWIAQSPSIYWSSKSYFQKSPDSPGEVWCWQGVSYSLLGTRHLPLQSSSPSLVPSTLLTLHWEFALNWKMDPTLLTPSLAFSATTVPRGGEIPSVSGNRALQELLFTNKGILLNWTAFKSLHALLILKIIQ